jgi:hypothetical protein
MALGTAQVEELAENYRRALRSGDHELRGNPTEKKILQAVVAASASDVRSWITAQVPGGADIDGPLADLNAELAAGDGAGAAVRTARQTTLRQATTAVKAQLITSVWPVWLSSMLALIGGLFGIFHSPGESAAIAIVGLTMTGFPALVLTVRGLGMARLGANRSSPLTTALVTLISDVGVRSEHIFASTMWPSFDAILRPEGMTPGRTPVVTRLRSWTRGVVFLTVFVFAACVIVYLAGLVQALDVMLGAH